MNPLVLKSLTAGTLAPGASDAALLAVLHQTPAPLKPTGQTLAQSKPFRLAAGTLAPGASDAALLAALHPTPAVCGRPRDAARAELARVEPFDRGFYAGPFGWVSGAAAEFVVAIRSALVHAPGALGQETLEAMTSAPEHYSGGGAALADGVAALAERRRSGLGASTSASHDNGLGFSSPHGNGTRAGGNGSGGGRAALPAAPPLSGAAYGNGAGVAGSGLNGAYLAPSASHRGPEAPSRVPHRVAAGGGVASLYRGSEAMSGAPDRDAAGGGAASLYRGSEALNRVPGTLGGVASLYAGVGLVRGSRVEGEWAELELKVSQFEALLRAPPALAAAPNLNALWARLLVEVRDSPGVRGGQLQGPAFLGSYAAFFGGRQCPNPACRASALIKQAHLKVMNSL